MLFKCVFFFYEGNYLFFYFLLFAFVLQSYCGHSTSFDVQNFIYNKINYHQIIHDKKNGAEMDYKFGV